MRGIGSGYQGHSLLLPLSPGWLFLLFNSWRHLTWKKRRMSTNFGAERVTLHRFAGIMQRRFTGDCQKEKHQHSNGETSLVAAWVYCQPTRIGRDKMAARSPHAVRFWMDKQTESSSSVTWRNPKKNKTGIIGDISSVSRQAKERQINGLQTLLLIA